ncbi:MAG: aminomethyl-transferring glycine dehydrogenase subunit GcvPA [Candidatus Melainabacteria bacterium]|nr:aminomethyl-transferring glycine dehydrogenase subunit GcvPA [Candidatus Melainabacteria bacterium]
MSNFLPHTAADRQAMLKAIGVSGIDALFEDIPAQLRGPKHYTALPADGLSELEIQDALKQLATENKATELACFLGGGAYDRFIPQAVNTIASRSEFATSYTPYQPEISQGTLQVIYEFQSMMASLTGMDVVNASVYDGASAVTEAALMAARLTKRNHIWVSRNVHPDYRRVLSTYVQANQSLSLQEFSANIQPEELPRSENNPACIILQWPGYLGTLEDPTPWQAYCEQHQILLVVVADPVSLGVLEPPGQYGASIVVGELQPLGNHLAYGGPYCGYIATRKQYLRQLPGRLVGRSVDSQGRPCFTLTLQTREQHIRREKATSNICTNQALNLLKATVYLSLLGPQGLATVASVSAQRCHYLVEKLCQIEGIALLFPDQPFLFEAALKLSQPTALFLKALERQGILGGIELGKAYTEYPNALLVTTTEKTHPNLIERYIQVAKDFFNPATAVSPPQALDEEEWARPSADPFAYAEKISATGSGSLHHRNCVIVPAGNSNAPATSGEGVSAR